MKETEMIIEVVNEPCRSNNDTVVVQRSVSCCGNEWTTSFTGE